MNYSELMLTSATDEEFRRALLDDPRKVLADRGFPVPDRQGVRIEESAPDELVFVVPPAVPDDVDLDDDALASVAGGTTPLVLAAVTAGAFGVAGFAGGYELTRHI